MVKLQPLTDFNQTALFSGNKKGNKTNPIQKLVDEVGGIRIAEEIRKFAQATDNQFWANRLSDAYEQNSPQISLAQQYRNIYCRVNKLTGNNVPTEKTTLSS